MKKSIKIIIAITLLFGVAGCSDFLSVDNDPPVQINYSDIVYFPGDTLEYTVRNNTGEIILLDGCDPDIRYTFELFEEGAWVPYTTINYGECADDQNPYVSVPAGDNVVESLDLDEAGIEPGFYRIVLRYRHKDDAELTDVPSDGITISE